MRDDRTLPPPLPRAPLWRRGAAVALDGIAVWIFSSVLGREAQWFLFAVLWLALRVAMASNNRGQSLGRYAFDIKIIDPRSRRLPTMLELFKREAIVGVEVFLALAGLGLLAAANPAALLAIVPLGADACVAAAEPDLRQSFHDRLTGTCIIQTRRGYSLDLRARRWFDRATGYLQAARDRFPSDDRLRGDREERPDWSRPAAGSGRRRPR